MTAKALPAARRIAPLLAILVAVWTALLFPAEASAQNIVCAPTGARQIAFATSDTASGSIGYNCQNFSNQPANITVCIGKGNPSFPGTPGQPLLLSGSSTLQFDLYTDPSASQVWSTTTPIAVPVSIAAPIGSSTSGSIPFYGLIDPGQSAPPGNYQAFFFNTVLGFLVSGSTTCQSNPTPTLFGQDFTLNVTAIRTDNCSVEALGPADLGSVAPSATNISGTTAISVTCPSGTPFTIGLEPSNGNPDGAGTLAGTGTSPDMPPYQLRSQGPSGPIWGNTATASSVGNGVAGTGSATPQLFTVYVTMPDANFRPDSYSDTVRVNVNF